MDKRGITTVVIAVVAVAAVVGLGVVVWKQLSPAPQTDTTPPGIGMAVAPPTLISDDGTIRVHMSLGKPMVGPNGKPDPYKWQVPAYKGKTFYMLYQCITTGKTWAYGKDGQIYSPFVSKHP